jgi:hypothetical protein
VNRLLSLSKAIRSHPLNPLLSLPKHQGNPLTGSRSRSGFRGKAIRSHPLNPLLSLPKHQGNPLTG